MRVEIIDDTHQRFNGIVYHRHKKGEYKTHCAVLFEARIPPALAVGSVNAIHVVSALAQVNEKAAVPQQRLPRFERTSRLLAVWIIAPAYTAPQLPLTCP